MAVLLFVAFLGLAIGSFLNVVVLRTEAGKKFDGRSKCPQCGHTLSWRELVPVLSWIVQGGRCTVCKCKISVQYPLVELLTALAFVGVFVHLAPVAWTPLAILALVVHCALWATLIVIAVYDLRTTFIPDGFNLTFALLALVATLISLFSTSYKLQATSFSLVEHLLAAALLFLPFYLLWKVSSGRWMGLGDGKLAIGIGLLLGLEAGFSAIMFAFWIGAVVMLVILGAQHLLARRATKLQATSYKLSLRSEIPFGPFLVIGTAVVYFTSLTYTTLLTPLFL